VERVLMAFLAALALAAGATRGRGLAAPWPATAAQAVAAPADAPAPPIADPEQLVAAYYQALAAAVNGGDFSAMPAFFSAEAGISSDLAAGGASGRAQILAFYQYWPRMAGLTIETSDVTPAEPYVDVDWRFRAAPGSLRGYLDGHDTFKIVDGHIAYLTQQVDPDAAAQAFLPPPSAPAPRGQGVARDRVRISGFSYVPAVVRVPVGATVTWTNADADAHSVTTDDRASDSGVIEEAVSVGLTFPTAGDFAYYCTLHPGMRGRVIVGIADIPQPPVTGVHRVG